jgi:large subunit ribosomal protein L22
MEVVATAKWVRTTARKARLVSAMVTGLPVAEALVVLNFSPRSAAVDIAKVIKSAAANAEHNYNLDASTLRVARVEVDGAMIIKRWRAKPRGMAGSIFKRTSHLRAFVTDDEEPANVRRRRAVKMPRTVVPTPVVTPAVATTPAAAAATPAPAAKPRAARRRTPKPATTEATAPTETTEAATETTEEAE